MRPLPEDPNRLTVNWFYNHNHVVVWEDADTVPAWTLRWIVSDRADEIVWQREETFQFVWDALARVAVIASTVENDERLVQSDLNVPSDRRAFTHLVTQFVAFASAPRESYRRLHSTRARR